jgi:hypothetical protein
MRRKSSATTIKKAIYRPGTLPECQVIKKRLSKKIEQARDVAVASSSEN